MEIQTVSKILSKEVPFLVREYNEIIPSTRPLKLDGGGICICTSGTAMVSIGTENHFLEKDNEAILLDDTLLLIRNCSEDFRMTIFLYSKEVAFQAMHKFEPLFFKNLARQPIWRQTKAGMHAYMVILDELQQDTHNRFATIMAMNLLRCIMLNIYDKMKRRGESGEDVFTSRKEDLFHKFTSLVFKYGRTHRDVSFYAEKLCVSTRYLGEVTQAISSESPKQFIDYFVISEIKLLLTFSEMTIQQMADYMHFPDQSYLGRYFKHHTGLSPHAYRTQELGR